MIVWRYIYHIEPMASPLPLDEIIIFKFPPYFSLFTLTSLLCFHYFPYFSLSTPTYIIFSRFRLVFAFSPFIFLYLPHCFFLFFFACETIFHLISSRYTSVFIFNNNQEKKHLKCSCHVSWKHGKFEFTKNTTTLSKRASEGTPFSLNAHILYKNPGLYWARMTTLYLINTMLLYIKRYCSTILNILNFVRLNRKNIYYKRPIFKKRIWLEIIEKLGYGL